MINLNNLGIKLENNHLVILDSQKQSSTSWDQLVYTAVFAGREQRIMARYIINEVARLKGIYPSSINALYKARASALLPDDMTVPALNIRGMVYDSARAIIGHMKQAHIGAVIFELAASEMEYTDQSPEEYVAVIVGAAVREGYRGPLFFQADHTQLRAQSQGIVKDDEYTRLTHHINRCVNAGFFNIDIDASTLVDLSQPSVESQQASNIEWTTLFTRFIRKIQPLGLSISVGGEIGHIGDKNSTLEDFEVFIKGLHDNLQNYENISKVSVQTGTSHGGVVDRSGVVGKMKVDFSVITQITQAGKKWGVGGAVQHGASTLPDSEFHLFPRAQALEIHLATGWQNILFDSQHFPQDLKLQIYRSLLAAKKDKELSDAQYLYKERKKAWGDFKQDTWDIDPKNRQNLRSEIAAKAKIIFDQLNINRTDNLVSKYALMYNKFKSIHEYIGD